VNADAEAKEVDEDPVASTIIGRYLPGEGAKRDPHAVMLRQAEIRAAWQSIELDNGLARRYDDDIKVCFCESYR
jgi:hypothetical protein